MKIFKRKLAVRIESLENELGLIYSVDTDGYGCHQQVKGHSILNILWDNVDELKKSIKLFVPKK